MNKYTELSDLEINKRVFVAAKIEHEDTDLHSNKVFYGDGANWIEFDPCNNPTNAMQIIVENKIAMNPKDDAWQCGSGWNVADNKNPLRAAMEVFLMMKDAENES
ncbi:DUF2591 domain-containing protein [Proteus mirabilis]|uniref:phage protein NinX family protein n=1 Tax=Proteus mirabilis TaxID=584 RepID=UPI001261B6CC|nr:phage protein NinX family protein [Proteus mirabilis]KAB7724148.1 DUF2591 domain-containing protein [Proteus mirabilis]HEJ9507488.1 DUF2591 family protein [Proteus mirabilis]HEK0642807.1 DUF2591 family protein [Proteus mirabilis]